MARVTLPTMDYPPEHTLDVRADATRGLTELEDDLNLRDKSADFIAIDADLSYSEREPYRERGTAEAWTTAGRIQEVNPYAYLVDVLQRVSLHPNRDVIALTPRIWKQRFGNMSFGSGLTPD